MIQKNIEIEMYEKTIFVNDRIFQWKTIFVLMKKFDFIEFKLIFDYHFVYEKLSKNIMKLITWMHNNLKKSNHRSLFSTNMKHEYWKITMHSKNRHYLSFHISKIDQLQFTRMSQKTKSFSFIYIELMNIILKFIFESNSKFSLLHSKYHNKISNNYFYIDDVFDDHVFFEKKYYFLKNHFFFRILWFQMKIFLKKLKIEMIQIKTLKQMHKINDVLNIKQKIIDIIKNWSKFQNSTNVRNFMKIILFTRKWIKNFKKITKSLNRFQKKIEWRWIESKKLIFQILKKLCFNVLNMFDHDSEHEVETYIDASRYEIDIYISQLQNEKMKSILYDFIVFNATQKNYDIYKKKLLTIVLFIDKYEYIFNDKKIFTIYTNHKSFVNFLNAKKHENIFVKWIIKLRFHNIRLKYIENKKNVVANDLSRVIFNHENCRFDQLIKKLYKKMKKHKNDTQWFWKFNKNDYQIMLKKLFEKNR